jgi:chromate transporter
MQAESSKRVRPTFAEALWFWLKLGFISFGGPTGQIAIMHAELVEKRRWISEQRFLHALNFCMLLPGPEATQLATYIGWLLHRTRGGIAAGVLFVLPSALLLLVLSWVYVTCGSVPWITAVFYGLKAAVLGIVVAALLRLGQRALKSNAAWAVAGMAFTALFFFKAPFPLVMTAAAGVGLASARWKPGWFAVGAPSTAAAILDDETPSAEHSRPGWRRCMRLLGVCLTLWWMPVIALGAWLGWDHTVFRQGVFFSKAAMVTFGGAYAVLPYVGQQAVEQHGWLSAHEMLDGLALAETTPGPLIMVLQFVGFVGAWHHPGTLQPLAAATLGAAITTWTTFVPCFLWIFLGAPHVERLRGQARWTTTLSAVTAAVAGVILNLAVWFGRAILLPEAGRVDWFALTLALVAFVGLWRWKWNLVAVVIGAGAAGWVWRSLAG